MAVHGSICLLVQYKYQISIIIIVVKHTSGPVNYNKGDTVKYRFRYYTIIMHIVKLRQGSGKDGLKAKGLKA